MAFLLSTQSLIGQNDFSNSSYTENLNKQQENNATNNHHLSGLSYEAFHSPPPINQGDYSFLFIEFGINYFNYSTLELDESNIYGNNVIMRGFHTGMFLNFLKNSSSLIFGMEANLQYDRYYSNTKLDFFDQGKIFDLFNTTTGLCLGYKTDPPGMFHSELLLKGGMLLHTYVIQQIDFRYFEISASRPYGGFGEIQYNYVNEKGNGFFLAAKLWTKIDVTSNFNSLASIDGVKFDLPSGKLAYKIGFRYGLF